MPTPISTTNPRADALTRLRADETWDVLIIGGGATGLGTAVDAASRGYRTLLLEAGDYACGTSSRSTKLIHGGIRYMRNGDFQLVRNALRERFRLLHNASHLVHPLPFIIPAWNTLDRLLYTGALKLYDTLAGWHNLEASHCLNKDELLAALPGLHSHGLCGGIRYWDGQFDDARLALTLMRTATDHGAQCLNYFPVTQFIKIDKRVAGVRAKDAETGEDFEIRARVVINATGVHVDTVRQLDEPKTPPLLTPSQGIHLVFDADFLPGNNALLIPKTDDGRVMFAIPWQGKVLIGTTDTPRPNLPLDSPPQPLDEEIDFLLRTAAKVLTRPPKGENIRSAFAGLRPLLHAEHANGNTSALSREHAILVAGSGLITVTGGKWTTYRLMAEEVVNRAAAVAGLRPELCQTTDLKLHGCPAGQGGDSYGNDAPELRLLPGHEALLHPNLPHTEAMVRFALRYESARTIEDILARRTRALFLDAGAAQAAIPRVSELVAEELEPTSGQLKAMIAAAQESAQRFMMKDPTPDY